MKPLIILCLLAFCFPALAQTPVALHCDELTVGDPTGQHCVLSSAGALFFRADGRPWCELCIQAGAVDCPVLRLDSAYLPAYTVEIRCDATGPIITYTQGGKTFTLTAIASQSLALAQPSPAKPTQMSLPANAYPPNQAPIDEVLGQPWQ